MHDGDAESRFFRVWAQTVLRLRWVLLALTLAVTAGAGWLVVDRLHVDNSTEYFASGDTEENERLERFRDDFGRDDVFFVLVEGDVFTVEFLARLRRLHEALEAADLEVASLGQRKEERDAARRGLEVAPTSAPTVAGFGALDDFGDFGEDGGWGDEEGGTLVEEVTSLVNFRQTVFEDGALRVRGLLDEPPEAGDLPALKATVLASPAMVGNVIGPGAQRTVLAVRTRFMDEDDSSRVNQHFAALARGFDSDGFRTTVTGMPALNAALNETVVEDARALAGVAAVVMAIVLAVLFRRVVQVAAPLAVVALSATWTLGAMAWYGAPLTIVSSILPTFLVCVGLGDSIHIVSVYRDELGEGTPRREALLRALATTGVPIAFTSLTTMAGLASFRFASATAIQEMGLAGAFGVGMALLNSVVFLPIALSLEPAPSVPQPREGTRRRDAIDGLLARCTALSARGRHRQVLAAGVLLVVVAAVGMGRLEVYHNPLTWLGDDHPITRDVMDMDAGVGGVSAVHLVVEPRAGTGVKDRETLLALDALAASLRDYRHPRTGEPIVTSTTSLVDIVKETNRALHRGDPDAYRIPGDQRAVSEALLLFENAGPDELSRLVTGDMRRTHLTVRVKWMDATAYEPLTEFIEAEVARTVGDRAVVSATGTVYSVVSLVHMLIGDLLRSFSVALVAVTIMMTVLLRDLRMGLVAMVPNLVPIAVVMGFMGFVAIPIDLSNLIIASIIIGIAVDDTVHYLHQFQVGRGRGVEGAIQHALDHAGRAIVSTTFVLTLGFVVFLSSRLVSIQRFGFLIGMACVCALLIDLVFTPALLRALYARSADAHRGG